VTPPHPEGLEGVALIRWIHPFKADMRRSGWLAGW